MDHYERGSQITSGCGSISILLRASLLTGLLAALVLLGACQPAPSGPAPKGDGQAAPAAKGGPVYGGTLRFSVRVAPSTLDGQKGILAGDSDFFYQIYNTLTGLNEKLEVIPELAEWEITDPKTIVLKVRNGIKTHDGMDFDANAVKYNFDRLMDPATKARYGPNIRQDVASVEVTDNHTVKLNLKHPAPGLLANMAEHYNMFVAPSGVQKYGADFERNPVGTGPFQFVEWKTDDYVSVKKFANYWEKDKDGNALPYLDGVIIRIIPDETVRMANLESGDLDLITVVPRKDVDRVKADSRYVYQAVPGLRRYELRINTSKPPFDNAHLRRALAYAIDRQAIMNSVFFGIGTIADSAIAPTQAAFTQKDLVFHRDLAKAKEELSLGGQPNGYKFQFDNRTEPTFINWAQAVAAQLSEVGITANIGTGEQVKLISELVAGNFEMQTGRGTSTVDSGSYLFQMYHSKGGDNQSRYRNPKFDELVDKANSLYDFKERLPYIQQADQMATQDVPYFYQHYELEDALYYAKVKNYIVYPDARVRFKEVWMEK